MGSLSHMRQAIFPALQTAYEAWRQDGCLSALRDIRDKGLSHWQQLASEILSIHASEGEAAAKAIAAHVSANPL